MLVSPSEAPSREDDPRMHRTRLAALVLLISSRLAIAAAAEAPEARLLRFPDIHGDVVVFVYGGDVWRVAASGGDALRLTSHEGVELFPKLSPDGSLVAYSAEYSGSRQVYVMPATGGEPKQLTFYTDVGAMPPRGGWDYWIQGFTPDGKILVRMNRTPFGERMGRYFLVDPRGGLEAPLELPHGGSASLSPDGKKLAYTPIDREFRTWKRELGGRAQDIWIYDLERHHSERLTDWRGTDNFPMWQGDTIYFTSDRGLGPLELFAHDVRMGKVRQLTKHADDVLWPSIGPGAIVYQNGGYLFRLDLATEKAEKIPIRIGSDLPARVPHFRDVAGNIAEFDVSPSGARAVFDARGDLFTVPAERGPTRNLTMTQGVRERSPVWSPDGRQIAYLSDATGEYEIWVRSQDGSGEPRQLTRGSEAWLFTPQWSPDRKLLAYGDQERRLRILTVESGKVQDVVRGSLESITTYVFSPDSKWLAFVKSGPTRLPAIGLYEIDSGRVTLLGDGLTADREPVFAADGKHLFFLSARNYSLSFSAFEFNYIYDRADRVLVAALTADAPVLFPPRSDEEQPPEEKKKEDAESGDKEKDREKDKDKDKKTESKPAPATGEVEAERFVAWTVAVPALGPGNYDSLTVTKEALFYRRAAPGGAGQGAPLYRYDLEKREEKKVTDGVQAFHLSGNGKKLLYRVGDSWYIQEAKADLKASEGKLDLSGLTMKLDPRAEWAQMFRDGWRIGRDWFYDPHMHGTDWKGLGEKYGKLVEHVAHRADLDFIFGELIGELEAGHTYVASGDEPHVDRVVGGMLGCELEATSSGRYRIARIFAGENWDDDTRSPLTEPGVDVHEGDFLLAIDGVDLRTSDNPYRLLENKADKQVVLKIAAGSASGASRDVKVVPVGSELDLRYIDWVRSRIALTDRLSDGRVGYIHLPDTAQSGNRMLQKLFYGQVGKPALIVDDRYNGGGFIPDRMIEYFERRPLAWWSRRDIGSMLTPGFAHAGPKAMLINGYSSSGGDALPYFFRKKGLGPLIGTRTWGGLIGLSGNPALVDGGVVQYPTFRIYDERGEWVVENEGVSPDIEVIDLPELLREGHDPSLERAVEVLLEELRENPRREPTRPDPPDMSGPAHD